ncbi:MAG: hypothetical protein K0Q46_5745 [Rhodococcus erythropolis]|nr:hypothetical protein [Rhodococcus erythropolis]
MQRAGEWLRGGELVSYRPFCRYAMAFSDPTSSFTSSVLVSPIL